MLTDRLPYRADASAYYAVLRDLPWPAWLDSGHPGGRGGRYDVIAADPWCTLETRGPMTRVVGPGDAVQESLADPLRLLREKLGEVRPAGSGLPFRGGAIGYLGYDLARRWMRVADLPSDLALPTLAIGLYDRAVVVDHRARRAWLVHAGGGRPALADRAAWLERLAGLPDAVAEAPPCRGEITGVTPDEDGYAAGFDRILAYIRDGDTYQVNFARRYAARLACDAWTLYRQARGANPAPYGGLLEFPFGSILSSSPEQFLSLDDGVVCTRPIKGTRPRGRDLREDEVLRRELAASAKDRAENLMIVDLLRNDLGQVCVPGSIQVPELFGVETYPTVHHLVSTVTGRLAPGKDAIDLLRACFPGGSITGAPKLRAMQIIDELEPVRREMYCGSLLRLGYDGRLDSSIAIRTMLKQDDALYYWAGGGIVADSDCDAELRESRDKAAAFVALVEDGRD